MASSYPISKCMPNRRLMMCGMLIIVAGAMLAVLVTRIMKNASPEVVYTIDVRNISQFIESNIDSGASTRGFQDVHIAIKDHQYVVEFKADLFLNNDVATKSVVIVTDELSMNRALLLYDSLEQVILNGPGKVMRPQGVEAYRHVVIDRDGDIRHSLSVAKYPVRVKYRASLNAKRTLRGRGAAGGCG